MMQVSHGSNKLGNEIRDNDNASCSGGIIIMLSSSGGVI